jgi:hypothetical protein
VKANTDTSTIRPSRSGNRSHTPGYRCAGMKQALALAVGAALLAGGSAMAAKPHPKPLPVTATFEISSTDDVLSGVQPIVLIKIARADGCRTRAPSPVIFHIGNGVYSRPNACNPYFAPSSWTSTGVTTSLFGPYRQLPRGWVAFNPFSSIVFRSVSTGSGIERSAPIDWRWTDPRTKTWDIPITVVSNGSVVASATFEVGYTISGEVVPARRIFEDDVDAFHNICINGNYRVWSQNGRLYCDVPEGFSNVRTALSLVRK